MTATYDAQKVLFDAPRNDHEVSMTVNIGRSFEAGQWLVIGGATWVNHRSNIELFDYRRRLVTVQLVRPF